MPGKDWECQATVESASALAGYEARLRLMRYRGGLPDPWANRLPCGQCGAIIPSLSWRGAKGGGRRQLGGEASSKSAHRGSVGSCASPVDNDGKAWWVGPHAAAARQCGVSSLSIMTGRDGAACTPFLGSRI